jgi:hypothetical protein
LLLANGASHVIIETPKPFSSLLKNVIILGENPLRCTTQDEKGLVLFVVLFNPIF